MGMDGPLAALLVPLDLHSCPGAGCLTHPSRRLGATKAGPAEAEGVSAEAAEGRSVEGSDRRGPGPKVEATQETEAKDVT